jgi:hypothetical protein
VATRPVDGVGERVGGGRIRLLETGAGVLRCRDRESFRW